jgi:hypothetical protein
MDTLPSRVLRNDYLWPARHYPRFRIWHPSSGYQRDFNPPELRAAQRTLCLLLTSAWTSRHLSMSVAQGIHADLPGYCAPTFTLMPVRSTPHRSVQVSGFAETRLLTPMRRLVSASYSSDQRFASGFLQIRSHPRHPCRQLTLPLAGCVEDFQIQVSAPCRAHELIVADGNADFIFGLGGNAVLSRRAEGLMRNARGHLALHRSLAAQGLGPAVAAVRLFGEFEYAAKSWPQAHRVVLKAEVLPGSFGAPDKDNERFVVTSMRGPSPRTLYQQEYCARGQAEGWIKQVKCDLKADRTSAQSFIANFGRLLFAAAAYVLHQQLRQLGLQGTALATAQPKTVILSLFKIAVRVKQYKDRVLLHLPTACPIKALLATVCKRLYPPNSRVRHAGFPMTQHVRLTRRCRPPFFITTSRFTLPVGVGGVSTENQKNRIKTEANALRKVYAIFRVDLLTLRRPVSRRRSKNVAEVAYLVS